MSTVLVWLVAAAAAAVVVAVHRAHTSYLCFVRLAVTANSLPSTFETHTIVLSRIVANDNR